MNDTSPIEARIAHAVKSPAFFIALRIMARSVLSPNSTKGFRLLKTSKKPGILNRIVCRVLSAGGASSDVTAHGIRF